MKYFKLNVLEVRKVENGKKRALCQCDCGKVKLISFYDLRRGKIKSCGCLTTEKMDLVGKRFGLLTVTKEANPVNYTQGKSVRRWSTKCDCGSIHEVDQLHLTRKESSTSSCGCVGKTKKYQTKSKQHYRRLYNIWHKMKFRCEKEYCRHYNKYGGRGIKVTKRWQKFSNFYNDMIDTYVPKLTIERVNVDGNYCKKNCIWIPNEDQAKNRRTTVWINGKCAKDACSEAGINYYKYLKIKNKTKRNPQELFNEMTLQEDLYTV